VRYQLQMEWVQDRLLQPPQTPPLWAPAEGCVKRSCPKDKRKMVQNAKKGPGAATPPRCGEK